MMTELKLKGVVTSIRQSVYGGHFLKFNVELNDGTLVQSVLLRDDRFTPDLKVNDKVSLNCIEDSMDRLKVNGIYKTKNEEN